MTQVATQSQENNSSLSPKDKPLWFSNPCNSTQCHPWMSSALLLLQSSSLTFFKGTGHISRFKWHLCLPTKSQPNAQLPTAQVYSLVIIVGKSKVGFDFPGVSSFCYSRLSASLKSILLGSWLQFLTTIGKKFRQ